MRRGPFGNGIDAHEVPEGTLERIMKRTEPGPGGCLLWQGATNGGGYGVLGFGGAIRLAHRVVFAASRDSIPHGAVVMHSCDIPACVNPDHLRVGTQGDNMRDCIAKGRKVSRGPFTRNPRKAA